MVEVTESDKAAAKQHQQRFLTEGRSETELLWEAFATHRIEAAKAERDRLRELLQSEAIRGRIGNALDNSKGMLHSYKISVIVETLADALESQP